MRVSKLCSSPGVIRTIKVSTVLQQGNSKIVYILTNGLCHSSVKHTYQATESIFTRTSKTYDRFLLLWPLFT
jgi:hypothetical protein